MDGEKEKNPHEGHRERMLDKLRRCGVEAFDDEQMMEMLLYLTIPRNDTKGMARKLLREFGSFSRVLDATIPELTQINGVGAKTATMIKLVQESFKVYYRDKCDVDMLMDSVDKYGTYLVCRMFGITEEVVGVVCLDGRNRFLAYKQLATGVTIGVETGTRKIVEAVLKCGAAGVVLTHNHPSGLLFPSEEDLKATQLIKSLLETIDVRLLDHVIVSGDEYMSMFQWGYM